MCRFDSYYIEEEREYEEKLSTKIDEKTFFFLILSKNNLSKDSKSICWLIIW